MRWIYFLLSMFAFSLNNKALAEICDEAGGFCTPRQCCPSDMYTDICESSMTVCCIREADCLWKSNEKAQGLWPRGNFALPRTSFGCPDNNDITFHVGRMRITSLSDHNHGHHTSFTQAGRVSRREVTMETCSKIEDELDARDRQQQQDWPAGKYCVYRIAKQCPEGLEKRTTEMSLLETDRVEISGIAAPFNLRNNSVYIHLCCKDEETIRPIKLGPDVPFSILPHHGSCPDVEYQPMLRQHLYIDLATEQNQTTFLSPIRLNDTVATIDFCYYTKEDNCYHERDLGASYRGPVNVTSEGVCGTWDGWAELESGWDPAFHSGMQQHLHDDLEGGSCRMFRSYKLTPYCLGPDWDHIFLCDLRKCEFPFDDYDVIDLEKPVQMNVGTEDDVRSTYDGDTGTCFFSTVNIKPWWQVNMLHTREVVAVFMHMEERKNHWHMSVSVGRDSEDFLTGDATYCLRNVSYTSNEYFKLCAFPTQGQFVTIYNYEFIPPDFQHTPLLTSLCEIEIFVKKEKLCGSKLSKMDLHFPSQVFASSGDRLQLPIHSSPAWCAEPQDSHPWITIDLLHGADVTSLVTQGTDSAISGDTVTEFTLMYGRHRSKIAYYSEYNNQPKIFRKEGGGHSPGTHQLLSKIFMRFLKLDILSYQGAPCLRVAVYGCQYEGASLVHPGKMVIPSSVGVVHTEPKHLTDLMLDTCFMTGQDAKPWILIPLVSKFDIHAITIRMSYNRFGTTPRMCVLDEAARLRYAGPVNVTIDGRPCLDWDLMPTFMNYPLWDPLKIPDLNWTLAENYCRNFDFDPLPICYVGRSDWNYCNVQSCADFVYDVNAYVGDTSAEQTEFCDEVAVHGMAVQYALVCQKQTSGNYVKITYDFHGFLFACDIEIHGTKVSEAAVTETDTGTTISCPTTSHVAPVITDVAAVYQLSTVDMIYSRCNGQRECLIPALIPQLDSEDVKMEGNTKCAPEPKALCKISDDGWEYQGLVAETIDGHTCQRWDQQTPHSHSKVIAMFPDQILEDAANYCRNPDGGPGPWCYTTNVSVRWQLCNVPKCESETIDLTQTSEVLGIDNYIRQLDSDALTHTEIVGESGKYIMVNISKLSFAAREETIKEINHPMDPGLCFDKITISYVDSSLANRSTELILPAVVFLPDWKATISVQTCERQATSPYDFKMHPISLFRITQIFDLAVTAEVVDCPGCGSQQCSSAACRASCGYITSPGYPLGAPLEITRCEWKVYVPTDQYIQISFLNLSLSVPNDISCREGYLEVYDLQEEEEGEKEGELVGRYCDLQKPPPHVLTNRYGALFRLVLPANRKGNEGFMLKYQGIQYQAGTGNQQLIQNHQDCPSGWYYGKNRCLQLFKEDLVLTWIEASERCRDMGTSMVTILNEDDMLLVYQLLIEEQAAGDNYIGLNDADKTGKWRWENGSPFIYSNWYPGQPDGGGTEQCVVIGMGASRPEPNWHDVPCAIRDVKNYICEIQLARVLEKMQQARGSTAKNCPVETFLCSSGECIHKSAVCDGKKHCKDASDEESIMCESTLSNMFQCDDGVTIPLHKRCDFMIDCSDNSDERSCVLPTCTVDEYTCSNGECVSMYKKCDLIPHCTDGSDENNCVACNPEVTFPCYDGSCIPRSRTCDGTGDCPGRQQEDESEICFLARYESCRDHALSGTTENGVYTISVPGGLGTTLVECVFEGGVATTVMHHDQEAQFYVKGYEEWLEYHTPVHYFNSLEHIAAIKEASSSCDQWVEVWCEFAQFWAEGGYVEGINGERLIVNARVNDTCHCALDKQCAPPEQKNDRETVLELWRTDCNCGSDAKWPVSDSGYLRNKTFLPVTGLCGGDTGSLLKEWTAHTIGPLQCHQYYNEAAVLKQCKNGNSYQSPDRCLYKTDTDGISAVCRDATHLQNCDSYICPAEYEKCPHSYCIPTHLACDGTWDCPNGEDEKTCELFDCSGLYSCENSDVCLPLSGICDGVSQCPHKDDELFCDLFCPAGCTCSAVSYICSGAELQRFTEADPSVKHLDLSRNSLSQVPSAIHQTPYLINLILRNNSIDNISALQFQIVPNLALLDLSENTIHQLVSRTFDGLANLKELLLQGNPISAIEPNAFFGLRSLPLLDLSNALISKLKKQVFQGMESLEHLDLSQIGEVEFQQGSFSGIYQLRNLNLSGNDIVNYDEKEFELLDNLDFLHSDDYMFCCFTHLEGDRCLPRADQFSSCEDLMSNDILRSFLWIIGCVSLFGNLFVLVFRRFTGDTQNVSSQLVSNLAASDLLMGLYMVVIASVDAYYRGIYIKHATDWRAGAGCQILGVMSTIASEVSVLTLLVLTLDRFKNIVFPFKGKRLTVGGVQIILACVWGFVICLAVIPLFPIDYFAGEFYSTSGVCISIYLTNEETPGWQYSVAIFHVMNLVVFLIIFIAYSWIYFTIQKVAANAGKEKKGDMTTARKMALIIFTDFCCWVPINIMGMMAISGYSIPATMYAVAVVFILPVNSALNPILYTISSIDIKQLRKDKDVSLSTEVLETEVAVTLCGDEGSCSLSDFMTKGYLVNPSKIYKIIHQVVRICEQSHISDMALVNISPLSVIIQNKDNDLPLVKYIVKYTDNGMSGPPDDMEDVGRLLSQMLQKLSGVRKTIKNGK